MQDETYRCLRCGREREVHDTNTVLKSEAELAAIDAEEIFPGYEMCLLTCCETPQPEAYTQLVRELSGTTPPYAIGFGAGYVSPDPEAEIKARQESYLMVAKTVLYFPSGFGGPVVDISG